MRFVRLFKDPLVSSAGQDCQVSLQEFYEPLCRFILLDTISMSNFPGNFLLIRIEAVLGSLSPLSLVVSRFSGGNKMRLLPWHHSLLWRWPAARERMAERKSERGDWRGNTSSVTFLKCRDI